MLGAVGVVLGNQPGTAWAESAALGAGIALTVAGAVFFPRTAGLVARVARRWRERVPPAGCLRIVDPVSSWPAGDGGES